MLHPYVVGSIIVGGVAVAYAAYLIYNTFKEEPLYVYNDYGKTQGGRGRNWRPRNGSQNSRSHLYYESSEDEELSLFSSEEKVGLRKRKGSKDNRRQLSSSVQSNNDEEQEELLDKLSYLNAVEQEIERKKKQLANEVRLLEEKEREIEQRKQNLSISTRSSRSNSNSDLWQDVSSPIGTSHANDSSTSTSTNNLVSENNERPLIIESPDPDALDSTPPAYSVNTSSVSEKQDNAIHSFSDTAAHTILSQDLYHISSQQKTPVVNYPASLSVTSNSVISASSKQGSIQPNVLPDQSCFLQKSVTSEDTWSELESVLSENIGSILSSAVDIDMEDIENIDIEN